VSPGLVGLVAGAVAGIASYLALDALKARVAMAESRKVLGIVAVVDLITFPVIGYLIGAYVFG
jgi:phage shock protein PspC (stress-responsive transcriptional regulator)